MWLTEGFSLIAVLATAAVVILQARASEVKASMELCRRRIETIRLDPVARALVDQRPMRISGKLVMRSTEDMTVSRQDDNPTFPYLGIIFAVPPQRYSLVHAWRAREVGDEISLYLASQVSSDHAPADPWWLFWNSAAADSTNWARLRIVLLFITLASWIAATTAAAALVSHFLGV
jgi:hypothetical protein